MVQANRRSVIVVTEQRDWRAMITWRFATAALLLVLAVVFVLVDWLPGVIAAATVLGLLWWYNGARLPRERNSD